MLPIGRPERDPRPCVLTAPGLDRERAMSTLLLAIAIVAADGPANPCPPIGSVVREVQLLDDRGARHGLDDWRSSRLIVLAFLAEGCPVAELYADRLAKLADRYRPSGVAFVGVFEKGRDGAAGSFRFAREHGLSFPIRLDDGSAALRLGARRTPEVIVLDEALRLRYRGRIDDQYAVGSRRSAPAREHLREAIESLLAGRPVERPEVLAVGCPIARVDHPTPAGAPTYRRDVAPILARRCVPCHQTGQVGPFPLTSYEEAADRAEAIAEVVEDGRMPPWHANPRFGRFANDPRLTDRERQSLLDWARGGLSQGDSPELPPARSNPDGWSIPAPDLVVSMPSSFTVPAGGVVDYQFFEVDPGFREDQWIRAAEIRPGNRRVVHHCNVFLRAPGSPNEIDTAGELGSYCLAAMTPGTPPWILPDGMAKRIPAGWRLVFVMHYQPVGTIQNDQTRIGLVLADRSSVRREVATQLLFDPDLRIPPYTADHRVERSRRFDEDVLLLSMFPHMHLRGRSFRYEALYPDGRSEILLDVPRYDFNWQNRYVLAEPRRLPAGTILRCTAHFDNSEGNLSNPDPGATVRAGKQTTDEMFNGYFDIALSDQDRTSFLSTVRSKLRRSCDSSIFLIAACATSLYFLRRHRGHKGAGLPCP